MMNELLFISHVLLVSGITFALRHSSLSTRIALMVTYSLLGNLMVLKQMTLLGLDVTTSDVYAVGVILVLNYIREHGDDAEVHQAMLGSFLSLILLAGASWFQLAYVPSVHDQMHASYDQIFSEFPRLVAVSAIVYLVVQYLDNCLFSWMKRIFGSRWFFTRVVLSLLFSQWLDTILFTWGALSHIAFSVWHVILFSGSVKSICALMVASSTAIQDRLLRDKHVQI